MLRIEGEEGRKCRAKGMGGMGGGAKRTRFQENEDFSCVSQHREHGSMGQAAQAGTARVGAPLPLSDARMWTPDTGRSWPVSWSMVCGLQHGSTRQVGAPQAQALVGETCASAVHCAARLEQPSPGSTAQPAAVAPGQLWANSASSGLGCHCNHHSITIGGMHAMPKLLKEAIPLPAYALVSGSESRGCQDSGHSSRLSALAARLDKLSRVAGSARGCRALQATAMHNHGWSSARI